MNDSDSTGNTQDLLRARGYWPAIAERHVSDGRYAKAVEMCRDRLRVDSRSVAGRLVYARALYQAGQIDSAGEQFYAVLARDPDNCVALKFLGDIDYKSGDELSAMAKYQRILKIDPYCRGLMSVWSGRAKSTETMRTITLGRGAEESDVGTASTGRVAPFYTETMGDLYMAQGHPRMAADVFRNLNLQGQNPRISEKLSRVEEILKEKEQ